MLDICTHMSDRELNSCGCCCNLPLRYFSTKVKTIRNHSDYGIILEWIVQNEACEEGFKAIMEVLFTEKLCQRTMCYRALTLLVCTYDVCARMTDNDAARKIFTFVENGVSRLNIDWTILLYDESTTATCVWNILKTLKTCCLNVLKCYSYYLKM